MAFQFLCPQGHLLQGDESQAGQRCKCPYCQAEFLVPQTADTAQADAPAAGTWQVDAPMAGPQQPIYEEQDTPDEGQFPEAGFPGIHGGGDHGVPADVAAQFGVPAAEHRDLLHIPCPNGHILETPRDMLGQDAMCPYCQRQFRLRFEDSREYHQERDERRQRREQKLGKAWMNWAIAAAVVVVLGLIFLIAVAMSK